MTVAIIERIDNDLQLSNSRDPAIQSRWFGIGVQHGYTRVISAAHIFVSNTGSYGYNKPIYKALLDSDQKSLAQQWLQENINFYHANCRNLVTALINSYPDKLELI